MVILVDMGIEIRQDMVDEIDVIRNHEDVVVDVLVVVKIFVDKTISINDRGLVRLVARVYAVNKADLDLAIVSQKQERKGMNVNQKSSF